MRVGDQARFDQIVDFAGIGHTWTHRSSDIRLACMLAWVCDCAHVDPDGLAGRRSAGRGRLCVSNEVYNRMDQLRATALR